MKSQPSSCSSHACPICLCFRNVVLGTTTCTVGSPIVRKCPSGRQAGEDCYLSTTRTKLLLATMYAENFPTDCILCQLLLRNYAMHRIPDYGWKVNLDSSVASSISAPIRYDSRHPSAGVYLHLAASCPSLKVMWTRPLTGASCPC